MLRIPELLTGSRTIGKQLTGAHHEGQRFHIQYLDGTQRTGKGHARDLQVTRQSPCSVLSSIKEAVDQFPLAFRRGGGSFAGIRGLQRAASGVAFFRGP